METNNRLIKQIEDKISTKRILDHPFYQTWNSGDLSKEALQDYATQYYKHVEAFPRYLSAVHTNTADMATRTMILENLNDEEAGHPNHPELWLQFAEALDLSREDVINATNKPETDALISSFHGTCLTSDTASGIAALYAYESQIPEVSETKIKGLKTYYGFDDPDNYYYFTVHMVADVVHAKVEHDILDSHLTDNNIDSALNSAETVLDGVWNLLTGVCDRHGIAC